MRIAIVNDLSIIAESLKHAVVSTSEHQVIWMARNGAEAIELCIKDRPDLVLMDLIMPGMDGVETIRGIMRLAPCAVLVVTASVDGAAGMVFEALGVGAIDAISTPVLCGPGAEKGIRHLLAKISIVGKIIGAQVARSRRAKARQSGRNNWLFAIGTSAGGPAALAKVLGGFPANTDAAFVVIQHLNSKFAPSLADWLGQQTKLPVRLSTEESTPIPGTVLLPCREDHLVLNAHGVLTYTPNPRDYAYRPSIDAFFTSVALHWKGDAAGVLLTGMGRDGAQGLKKMREASFPTIAQDQNSSAVYGMPQAAAQLGAAERILPLSAIGSALQELL